MNDALFQTAWSTLANGYAGTPAILPYRTDLVCAPAWGIRLADPTGTTHPIDDYYVASPDDDASAVLAVIRAVSPMSRAYLTVAEQSPATDRIYQSLGCVYDSSECLMSYDLRQYTPVPPTHHVDTLTVADIGPCNTADPEAMIWLNEANVAAPQMTHVAVRSGPRVLARARTLRLPNQTSYISMVYTAPQARRNGYARDLMLALLAADAAAGVHTAVLMSSQMAIPLYRSLGFVPLCNTHIYTI